MVRSRKRLALLAYLAAAHPVGFHRRDTIVGLLWSESDQRHARGALRQAVRHLRGELGTAVVSRGSEELGLDWDDFWCDAPAFRERLEGGDTEGALALYGGDLLDGFCLSRTPGFDEWLDQERRALRRAGAEAAWNFAEQTSDAELAARWARTAASFTPYDETAARHLMTFLGERDDAIGALREFDRFERRIREEFGAGPGAETRTLADSLRSSTATSAGGAARRSSSLPNRVTADGAALIVRPHDRASPVQSSKVGRGEPALGPKRLLWALVGATAGFTLIFAAGFGGRDRAGIQLFDLRRVTDYEGSEISPALSPDGTRVVYAAGGPNSTDIYMRRTSGGQPVLLSSGLPGWHIRPTWAPDGEQVAFLTYEEDWTGFVHLTPATGGAVRRLTMAPSDEGLDGLSWSPDGSRLALKRGRAIVSLDVETGVSDTLATAWAPHSMAWSPDGDRIAFVSENSNFELSSNVAPSSVWVVPAEGGDPTEIVNDGFTNQSPSWWPDGRHLLFVSTRSGASDAYSVELGDDSRPIGTPEALTRGLGLLSARISADGKRLVYAQASAVDWDVWTIAFPRGTEPARLAEGDRVTSGIQVIETLGLSPDGQWLAFDSDREGNQDIYVVPTKGGDALRLTRDPSDDFAPSWSPSGRELVFYSFRTGSRDIFVMNRDGQGRIRVTDTPGSESFPSWSTDGDQVIYAFNPMESDSDVQSILLRRRGAGGSWSAAEVLLPHPASAGKWSPDGRWIAYRGERGELRVLQVDSGESRVVLTGYGATGLPVWSGDSETIFFGATRDDTSGIWAVPRTGGEPRLVAIESRRRFGRFSFDTDGERIYYTALESRESDIWIADVMGRP